MKQKILVILGPTSTGKTTLAIKLAKEFNGEIINADAFQVYKELNIGVNKPTLNEQKQVKFHLLNEVSIKDKWDIKEFQDKAYKCIETIIANNRLPIICGGSSMYVDTLIKNYDLSKSPQRTNVYDHLDAKQLYTMLSKYDKELADKNVGNHKRLARALEIAANNEYQSHLAKPAIYDFKIILTSIEDRKNLYDKINSKVDQMIKEGWVDEVKSLMKINDLSSLNAFKAIGYLQIYNSILDKSKLDLDLIKQKSRRYAKRQITWNKNHYSDYISFNQNNYNDVVDKVKKWIK